MSNVQICPIWGTPAEVEERDFGEGLRAMVDSPRAGGLFKVADAPGALNPVYEDFDRVKLTNWIVDQHRFVKIPTLTPKISQQIRSGPSLQVFERADRLLRYLSRKSVLFGHVVGYKKMETSGEKTRFELLASTGSTDISEVITLSEYCHQQGWITYKESKQYLVHEMMLRPPGYARLAELDGANPESSQAFVAMWFDPDGSMNAPREAIRRAIEDEPNSYKAMIIDEKQHIDKIDDQIIAEIRRSRFLVADFTAGEIEQVINEKIHIPRGGVYYEAGFAQGLNIPVIWTCKADQIKRIHFDTRQFNHITWENPDDLYEQLKNRIGAVIGDGPHKNKRGTE